MKIIFTRHCSLLLLIVCLGMQCPGKRERLLYKKVTFDFSALDDQGLRNGEASVDYEFCIPGRETTLTEIQQIEPDVRVMKGSRGRIGCSGTEWLCIINTHDPDWHNTILQIAALPYVDRIAEVFYE